MSFKNKIAVVTGGATGLGFGIASHLASQGATVVITGRRQQQLDQAVASIGANASAIKADISNLAELDALYREIKAEVVVLVGVTAEELAAEAEVEEAAEVAEAETAEVETEAAAE